MSFTYANPHLSLLRQTFFQFCPLRKKNALLFLLASRTHSLTLKKMCLGVSLELQVLSWARKRRDQKLGQWAYKRGRTKRLKLNSPAAPPASSWGRKQWKAAEN